MVKKLSHSSPKIKICCISSTEDAKLAISYGASALGLVSAMPSGPGPIPETLITKIASMIPPGVSSFLLTCEQRADEIIRQQRTTRVNTLQLVDAVSIETYTRLRDALRGISIVQVIHVVDESSIDMACSVAPYVDAILLDSGNPNLAVKELGGTGRTHDWSVSRKIRDAVGVPIFLAGGLNAENVARAIDEVQPFGIDVCNGVRSNGKLDEAKLSSFIKAITSSPHVLE